MNKDLQSALDAAQTMLQMLNEQNSDDMLLNSLQGYAASIVDQLQKLQQTECKMLLPLLEDAWNAGVDQGYTRARNIEWAMDGDGEISFRDWYGAKLENKSSGQ